MGNRIRWILVSYLTNRVFLTALVLVSLWIAGVTFFNLTRPKRFQSNLPPAPRGTLTVYSEDSLAEVRRLGLQEQVDAINLGNLWSSMEMARQKPQSGEPGFRYSIGPPPNSFYDVLDEFPNLRIVELGFHDQFGGIERVAELRQLTYLKTDSGPIDLGSLSSLKTLERLELGSFQQVKNFTALAALPRLKTLILATDQGLTAENFAELARLPHLKTLGIRTSFNSPTPNVDDLAQLGASRTLETFYAGGNNLPPQIDLLAKARKALPKLDVRPAVVPSRPPLLVGFPPAALAMVVGFVVVSQFRNANLRLAPYFVTEHLAVGVGWCLLVGLAMLVSFAAAGISVIAGVLIATGMLAVTFSGGVELYVQRKVGIIATPNRWASAAQAIAIILVMFSLFRPSSGDGISPWLAWSMAGLGLWSFTRSWKLLRSLPSLTGGAPDARRHWWSGGTFRPGWWFATASREQSIEALAPEADRPGFWYGVHRWRMGNQPRISLASLLIVMAMFLVGSSWVLVYRLDAPNLPEMIRMQAVVFAFFLLSAICGQVSLVWRKRLTVLAVESLWPVSRSVLQRQMATALAVDLVIPAMLAAAFAAIALNLPGGTLARPLSDMLHVEWSRVPGDWVVFAVVIWSTCCAICGLLVVIERGWVRLLLTCGIVALTTFVTVLVAALAEDLPRNPMGLPRVLVHYLWIPISIACAVAAWIWQLWRRMDFDRQSA